MQQGGKEINPEHRTFCKTTDPVSTQTHGLKRRGLRGRGVCHRLKTKKANGIKQATCRIYAEALVIFSLLRLWRNLITDWVLDDTEEPSLALLGIRHTITIIYKKRSFFWFIIKDRGVNTMMSGVFLTILPRFLFKGDNINVAKS